MFSAYFWRVDCELIAFLWNFRIGWFTMLRRIENTMKSRWNDWRLTHALFTLVYVYVCMLCLLFAVVHVLVFLRVRSYLLFAEVYFVSCFLFFVLSYWPIFTWNWSSFCVCSSAECVCLLIWTIILSFDWIGLPRHQKATSNGQYNGSYSNCWPHLWILQRKFPEKPSINMLFAWKVGFWNEQKWFLWKIILFAKKSLLSSKNFREIKMRRKMIENEIWCLKTAEKNWLNNSQEKQCAHSFGWNHRQHKQKILSLEGQLVILPRNNNNNKHLEHMAAKSHFTLNGRSIMSDQLWSICWTSSILSKFR